MPRLDKEEKKDAQRHLNKKKKVEAQRGTSMEEEKKEAAQHLNAIRQKKEAAADHAEEEKKGARAHIDARSKGNTQHEAYRQNKNRKKH